MISNLFSPHVSYFSFGTEMLLQGKAKHKWQLLQPHNK